MDIPPPKPFRPDGHDSGQSWRAWKQAFTVYLSARDLDGASGKRKVSLLLHLLGNEGIKLYNTFQFQAAVEAAGNVAAIPAEDRENLETVLRKFDGPQEVQTDKKAGLSGQSPERK